MADEQPQLLARVAELLIDWERSLGREMTPTDFGEAVLSLLTVAAQMVRKIPGGGVTPPKAVWDFSTSQAWGFTREP